MKAQVILCNNCNKPYASCIEKYISEKHWVRLLSKALKNGEQTDILEQPHEWCKCN